MYDENHVTIVPKSGNYIKSDRYKLWDCFLCGELVGGIQFITDGGYKKHYESQVLDSDGRGPMRFVGRHNSLYEAKVALVEPAREYLRKKKSMSYCIKRPLRRSRNTIASFSRHRRKSPESCCPQLTGSV